MAGKTDNRFLESKVNLRVSLLPKNEPIHVLDCFHGIGHVWDEVKKQSRRTDIDITGIDTRDIKGVLNGDNRRWLRTLDLSRFNIIDLDAYGSPFHQIEILINRKYTGCVFFTWCKNLGTLPINLQKYCSSPWCDIGLSENILSAYFFDLGIQEYNLVKHKKAGGFNFYGHFTLGNRTGLF